MAKVVWRRAGESASRIDTRRSDVSGQFSPSKVRSLSGAVLTQKVSKALKSANTVTQTFKPKNAR
jgi:hypothetical protein